VVFLAIGGYITYLGLRGRRITRSQPPEYRKAQ
jgi:hypothetical protein